MRSYRDNELTNFGVLHTMLYNVWYCKSLCSIVTVLSTLDILLLALIVRGSCKSIFSFEECIVSFTVSCISISRNLTSFLYFSSLVNISSILSISALCIEFPPGYIIPGNRVCCSPHRSGSCTVCVPVLVLRVSLISCIVVNQTLFPHLLLNRHNIL